LGFQLSGNPGIGSNLDRLPALRRRGNATTPTADARQNAQRVGSHAGGLAGSLGDDSLGQVWLFLMNMTLLQFEFILDVKKMKCQRNLFGSICV
jgi:hypothetical protein